MNWTMVNAQILHLYLTKNDSLQHGSSATVVYYLMPSAHLRWKNNCYKWARMFRNFSCYFRPLVITCHLTVCRDQAIALRVMQRNRWFTSSNKLSRGNTPPIAADLRPCADRSAVRTALAACSLWRSWLRRWERQTDESQYRLMPSTAGA